MATAGNVVDVTQDADFMSRSALPLMKSPIPILWNLAKSWFLGFFFAGAVVFPLVESYYLPRVILTFGLVGIGYGINGILTFGHVTTSGWLSDNETFHDVRVFGFILWLVFFIYFAWRDRRARPSV